MRRADRAIRIGQQQRIPERVAAVNENVRPAVVSIERPSLPCRVAAAGEPVDENQRRACGHLNPLSLDETRPGKAGHRMRGDDTGCVISQSHIQSLPGRQLIRRAVYFRGRLRTEHTGAARPMSASSAISSPATSPPPKVLEKIQALGPFDLGFSSFSGLFAWARVTTVRPPIFLSSIAPWPERCSVCCATIRSVRSSNMERNSFSSRGRTESL